MQEVGLNPNKKWRLDSRSATGLAILLMVILGFTIATLFLLYQVKEADNRLTNHYGPVLTANSAFQNLIHESGILSGKLAIDPAPETHKQLEDLVNRIYPRQLLTLTGLCLEPELTPVKNEIMAIDQQFSVVIKLEKDLLASFGKLNETGTLTLANKIREEIADMEPLLVSANQKINAEFNRIAEKRAFWFQLIPILMLVLIGFIILFIFVFIRFTNHATGKSLHEFRRILEDLVEGNPISVPAGETGELSLAIRKLAHGIKAKEQVIQTLTKGDYDIKVPLLNSRDRLGLLISELRDQLKKGETVNPDQSSSLEEKISILEKKNRELDQFNHLVSHDLKSPMRGINSLVEWILEDSGEVLSGESKQYFFLLQQRVNRLDHLISSLLKFSKAGKTPEGQEEIDTGKLVFAILEQSSIPANAHILIDERLARVRANREDLSEVFRVLIHNALVHNPAPEPVLNITFRQKDSQVEFCVADNGPGIAEEFHQKVFSILQTLARRDDSEFVGAGLAIAKKIVEDYGGQIRLESTPGKGARFYFTWPV